MNEKNDVALAPRPPSAIQKALPGAKRILASMTSETLALARREVLLQDRKPSLIEDAETLFQRGLNFYHGQGVPEDDGAAVKCFQKAADQGHSKAQIHLGTMYAFGQGVPGDAKEAVKWFRKAADQGNAEAQFNLGEMYDECISFAVEYDKDRDVPEDDKTAAK